MWRDTTLTILNTQTESPELDLAAVFPAGKLSIVIFAPVGLTKTVTVHVAKSVGGTYVVQQSGGLDVTLPAGKGTSLDPLVAGAMKLVADVAVGANRIFEILAVPAK